MEMGMLGRMLISCLLTLDIGGHMKDLFKGRQMSFP